MSGHHSSIRYTLLYGITFVMLGFFCLLWFAVHPRQVSATTAEKHSSAAVSSSCPDAKPVIADASPSLDFCSPKYGGNAAGPVGTHLVLVGENFPQDPVYWLLTQDVAPTKLQQCLSSQLQGCRRLPPPKTSKPKASMSLFSWTWNSSDFPTTIGNYYFVAVLGQQPPFQTVPSSVNFSLLISQPPCISIHFNQGPATGCTQSQSISLPANTTITLVGSHWRLGWRDNVQTIMQTIQVTARCASPGQCSQDPLFVVTIQGGALNTSGAFMQQVTLPQNATGTYTLSAFNQVPQIATPNTDPNNSINTVADNALTFGTATDSTGLTIQMLPALVPTPSPSLVPHPGSSIGQQLTTFLTYPWFPLVAALPSLVAIVLFFIPRLPGWWKSRQNTPSAQSVQAQAEEQQQIQAAIDALANMQPEQMVSLAAQALSSNSVLWNTLRNAIIQMPEKDGTRQHVKSQCETVVRSIVQKASSSQSLLDVSRALIYSLWYLNFLQPESVEAADTRVTIGNLYDRLAKSNSTQLTREHYEAALDSYYIALDIYENKGASESDNIMRTLNKIGDIYINSFPFYTDQVSHVQLAIRRYEKASRWSHNRTPISLWARTILNLSTAYSLLSNFTRNTADLQAASQYAQQAFKIYKEKLPNEQRRLQELSDRIQEIARRLQA